MAVSVARSGAGGALRRLGWRRPEWPWAILAVAAWAWLAWADVAPELRGGHMAHMGAPGGGPRPEAAGGPAHWAVMVVAMMLPAALPMIRAVSVDSLWHRRLRAGAVFAAVYLGAWIAAGGVALALWAAAGADRAPLPTAATVVVLLSGAAWQLTRRQRRCLKACHRRRPVGVRGRSADLACARSGAGHAGACIGACGPAMLAMVPAHSALLMIALTGLTSWQRLARRPRRVLCAAALLVLALAVALIDGAGV